MFENTQVYLKSSECLKTETVVNVGAICQLYNYTGERSVFINKQDQFFPKGKGLSQTVNPGLEIQCTHLGVNLKR